MILLISPEETSDTEIQVLHQLFEAGLAYFHLRKPHYGLQAHLEYLQQIRVKYHNRIITHNYHESLCKEFTIRGIHLEEAKWRAHQNDLKQYVASFKETGKTVSASYHEPEDLVAQTTDFDYVVLSPVFSAISKRGMEGRGFDVRHIDKFVVGMGGINAKTTPEAVQLGFKGVGALGGVWNSKNPVLAFQEMQIALKHSKK